MSLSTPLRLVGGIEVQLHSFVISALDEGECLTHAWPTVPSVKELRYPTKYEYLTKHERKIMFPVTKYCICHIWKSVSIRRDVKCQRAPVVFLNELQTKPLGILGTSLCVQYFPFVGDTLELGRLSLFPGQ